MPRAPASAPVVDVLLPEPADDLSRLAERLVGAAARRSPVPVLHVRVRLIRHADPAVRLPVVAKATLSLAPGHVRAEAVGRTEQDALERLHDRIVAQLDGHVQRASGSWEARRARLATGAPHAWRHGDPPAPRPPYFPRPEHERQIILHTSVSPDSCDVDEAAEDMVAMDYWFHLFTEVGSVQDSVLYRTGDGYRLQQVDPLPERLAAHLLPVEFVARPAPMLSVPEAEEQLRLEGLQFLLFLYAERACGALVYHRYDGHYGLVLPSRQAG